MEFDDVYDDATMAAIDRYNDAAEPRREVRTVGGWRGGLGASAIFLAAAAGVQEALEPERKRPVIEELDLTQRGDETRAVEVWLVPGFPRRSRIVVRPWLLACEGGRIGAG